MATIRTVLIIGGSGFIGTHLALKLREGFKVFATYESKPIRIRGVTCLPLDVSNRNWVKRVAYTARPDVIVYAAGPNSVEWAEANSRDAERLHTGGPATVSNVADILQPRFIYLSNSYVFDGTRGNYHEGDTVLPSSAIGKAKVGGENFIRGKALNHIIVRASPLFGRGNGLNLSFLDHLRARLEKKDRIELSNNELHSFASATAFADFIARLADSGPRNKTLHFGGLTKVSFFEFAKQFARRFGYNPDLVFAQSETTSRGMEIPVSDYSLNSTYIAETLKFKPLLLEEGFDLLEKQLIPRS